MSAASKAKVARIEKEKREAAEREKTKKEALGKPKETAMSPAEVAKAKAEQKIKDEIPSFDPLDYDDRVVEIEEEIAIEKGNTTEKIASVKKEAAKVRANKKLSAAKKKEKIAELKEELDEFKEDQADLIDSYRDDIKEVKAEKKADEKEFNKAKKDAEKKGVQFRLKGDSLGVSLDETDAETLAILEAMNETGAQIESQQSQEIAEIEARLELNKDDKGKTLTVAKRNSLRQRADELSQKGRPRETESKATKIDVEELNSRLDNPLPTVEIEELQDVPGIFNISDQLRTGDIVNPATGNTITNLKGGMGFTGVKGHQDMAWASVTRDKSQGQIDSATKAYNDNKEFYNRWWKANPQWNGLVPMFIV